MNRILFAWVLLFASFALSAEPVPFDILALQQKFSQPAQNNGPNCYNTTLIALGYMDDIIHVSPNEMNMYLKLFCKEQDASPEEAVNGEVLAYFDQAGLTHTAAALGDGQVLEKYSYLGAGIPANSKYPPGSPGLYLFQKLAHSAYYREPNYRSSLRVFQCAPATQVSQTLQEVSKTTWAQQLLQKRKVLAREIVRIPPQEMAAYLTGPAVRHIDELTPLLQSPVQNSLEGAYLFSVVASFRNQIFYLADGYITNCSDCDVKDFQDLKTSLKNLDQATQDFLKKHR